MEFLNYLATACATVILGVLTNQLYDASPRLAHFFLRRASSRLSAERRERYEEEWAAHSHECLGKIGKLVHALGCLQASYRMEPPALILLGRQICWLYCLEKAADSLMWLESRPSEALARSFKTPDDVDPESRIVLEKALDRQIDLAIRIELLRNARKALIERVRGSGNGRKG